MTLAAKRIGLAETGTPEWHRLREGKMSGSRIAATLGLSPWVSKYSLYWQMVGLLGEQQESEQMSWGTWLEPVILGQYAARRPWVKVRTRVGVWQNKARTWQVASPDGLVIHPGVGSNRNPLGLVEVKTSRYDSEWGEPGTDQIPVYYRCQVLHYMDVMGLESCDVAALFTGSAYREYTVWHHQEDIEILRTAGQEMLERVASRTPPDIDGSDATYEAVQKLHPLITAERVQVEPEMVAALIDTKTELERAAEEHQAVKAQLAEEMGDAHTAWCGDMKVADRRAKTELGTPFVQMASMKKPTSTIKEALDERRKAA